MSRFYNIIKNNKISSIYFFLVFLFFLLFYSVSHPPIITTSDDWHFMATTRDAIPLITVHNPSRVMIEVFAPYAGMASVAILKPFGVDFVSSLAYGTAFLLACFIVIYVWNFYRLLKDKFQLDEISTLCITTFFLLFHFLSFRRYTNNNPFLLGSYDLCCYYHYTIPILLISSLVMYCIRTNLLDNISSKSPWRIGVFLALVYLVLFSHLYTSIIWIAYISVRLLFILFKQKGDILGILRRNKISVFSFVLFAIALLFEAFGDNAQQISTDENYWSELHHTLGCYWSILHRMNKWFMCFCFLVFIYSFYVYRKNAHEKDEKNSTIELIIFFFGNFIIINLFYILISAKAIPEYVVWQDRLLAEALWGLLGVSFCMAYCLKKRPQIKTIVPFVFLLLLGDTNTTGKTFNDVYMYDTVAENTKKLEEIAVWADRNNLDTIDVYIPYNGKDANDFNWPYTIYYGSEIAESLQKFNVTKRLLNIRLHAVKGRNTISTELMPYENDSIIKDSFWWGE